MKFDVIIVPRGAEADAVVRGWSAARPKLLIVPAGPSAADIVAAAAQMTNALVFGLCGALDPALRVGDAVVYARIHDGSETIALDADLAVACAADCGGSVVDAAAVTRVVGAVDAKRALRQETGAAVIDMEAAAIARVLARRGVRVAMVRVVSDDAATALPDLGEIYDARGSLRPIVLAGALLRTPVRGARFVTNALQALRALRRTAAQIAQRAEI